MSAVCDVVCVLSFVSQYIPVLPMQRVWYHDLRRSLDQIPEASAQTQPLAVCFFHRLGLSLLLVELLVQSRKHDSESVCSNDCRTKHGGDNAITGTVGVCFVEPHVRSSNVSDLAECVDEGNSNGTLCGRTWE
jgi:hypothetical protein